MKNLNFQKSKNVNHFFNRKIYVSITLLMLVALAMFILPSCQRSTQKDLVLSSMSKVMDNSEKKVHLSFVWNAQTQEVEGPSCYDEDPQVCEDWANSYQSNGFACSSDFSEALNLGGVRCVKVQD